MLLIGRENKTLLVKKIAQNPGGKIHGGKSRKDGHNIGACDTPTQMDENGRKSLCGGNLRVKIYPSEIAAHKMSEYFPSGVCL